MYYFILIPLVIWVVWTILRLSNVFSTSKGFEVLNESLDEKKKLQSKRLTTQKRLLFFESIAHYFESWLFNEYTKSDYKFVIDRLEIKSKVLDRNLTPHELRGIYIFILLLGIIFLPLSVIKTPFIIISILGIGVFLFHMQFYNLRISDEDELIDLYFTDLYLLLYSRLKMGSRGRIMPVVESYVSSLKQSGNKKQRKVMLKFAQVLLNNLNMYEDHEAVPKLRDRYRSATIVNFCNTASQALQGVDNADTLLTFKMELISKRTINMKKKSEKLIASGERAIYLIYVVLFQFILLGWWAKMPVDIFKYFGGGK